MMNETPRNRLAMFRDLSGMSQADLAARIGVTQSTIARAESEHPSAKLSTYRACAEALGITLEDMFSEYRDRAERELHLKLRKVPAEHYEAIRSLLDLARGPSRGERG